MTPKNVLTIYYDPTSSLGKKTRATAEGLTSYLHVIDINHADMTPTRWRQVLNALDMRPKDLLNKAHPQYQELIQGTSFDNQGWLNILVRYPHLLRGPIVLKGNKAILCEQPNDVDKVVREGVN